MNATINMQDMRYLNLFAKISRVSTRYCFKYNEAIVFCVPKRLVSKSLGENAKNVKQISQILGKRIKVIPVPDGIKDAKEFIQSIVSPVTIKDLEIHGNEIILNPGSQSKAALIGRNKRRLIEMQKIIKDFFGKEFRIA